MVGWSHKINENIWFCEKLLLHINPWLIQSKILRPKINETKLEMTILLISWMYRKEMIWSSVFKIIDKISVKKVHVIHIHENSINTISIKTLQIKFHLRLQGMILQYEEYNKQDTKSWKSSPVSNLSPAMMLTAWS